MATVQDHARTASTAKHEAFVEHQLARALGRIRMLDVTAAVFGLLIGTLAYGLVMILFGWSWPSLYRQIALAVYGLTALTYVAVVLVRPLFRRVNPYYAAKQVEQALPGAKNSVVNWLDLHRQPLPPAIRGALGVRAAHDLAQADLDRAITARQVFWLGGAVFTLVLAGLVALCILRPGPFFSRFFKTFAPFSETPMATRTRLQLVEPAGGDAVVPVNQSVAFSVWVSGLVPEANRPDSVRLLFRYNPSDPGYQEKLFEPGNSEREWGTRLPAFQVQNGFWYRVAGGDTVTPEYRVQVRSTPLLTGFEATYHYRPYLHWRDATSRDPNLEALRGTQVTLVAHTNRTVAEGRLFLEGQQKPIPAERDPAQPDVLRFRLVLDQDSQYRIRFTSSEGEENANPMPYRIHVLHDQPPRVELTKPGENIALPSNGVLQLEGFATDDIGLTALMLRLRIKDGAVLQPKPYRGGMSFKLADGSYPRRLEYKDFVELDKVKDDKGEPMPLRGGIVLEYWLEATDNCDYPQPNVGRSEPIFEVKIVDPEKNQQKMEQQRAQAKQEQQKHEAQQDKAQEKENQEAKDRAAQQNPEQAEKEGKEQEQKLEDIKNKLQKEIEKKQQEQEKEGPRGQSKDEPKPEPKGESKDKGQSDGKGDAKQPPDPKPQPGEQPGQGKDGGKPDAPQQPKAQEKPENKPGQGQEKPAQGKPELKPDQQPGQGKNEGKSDPHAVDKKPADGQRKPQPQQGQNPSQGKPEGNPLPDSAKGNDKKGGQDNGPSSAGEAKGDQQSQARAEPKPGGKDVDAKGTPRGKLKKGNPGSKSAGAGKGEPGSDPQSQVDGKGVAKGSDKDPDRKPVAGDNHADVGRENPPTAEDVQCLAKKLQSPDKKEREEALRKLQEISQQGTKLSKEAADELKKAGHDAATEPGSGPKDPASPQQPGDTGAAGSKPKGQGPDGDPGAGKPKKAPGQPDPKQGSDGSGSGKQDPKEGTPQSGNAPGDGKSGNQPNGGNPGGGSRTGEAGGGGPEEGTPEPADPNNQKKAGELQLKTFKEQVTRDMLKKYNISEEEYRRFLKAYEEANRRKAQQPQPKEPAAGPQHGGALGNVGPRRVDPGTGAKPDNVQGVGPSVPPPEYRKAYKDFTEELSKLKRAKKP